MVAASVLGLGLPSYANLLTNGSFEDGNFIPDTSDSKSLEVGATDMTGWAVQTAGLAWIGPSNPFSLSASAGSYFLDLSGYHDNAPYGGVLQSQTIATTIGAQYELSFDLGTDVSYDTAPVSVQVTAGSTSQLFTAPVPAGHNQWQTFSLDFVATSANTSISLNGQAGTDQKYIGLDNVNLDIVPEPGVLALLAGPGLLALAACRRRRKG